MSAVLSVIDSSFLPSPRRSRLQVKRKLLKLRNDPQACFHDKCGRLLLQAFAVLPVDVNHLNRALLVITVQYLEWYTVYQQHCRRRAR